MDEEVKTTIRLPRYLIKEYKNFAKNTHTSMNSSIETALKYFLSKEITVQISVLNNNIKKIKIPTFNMGNIKRIDRKSIYEDIV